MALKNNVFAKKLTNTKSLKDPKKKKKAFILDERGAPENLKLSVKTAEGEAVDLKKDLKMPDVVKDQKPLFDLPVTDKTTVDSESVEMRNESAINTQSEHNASMLVEMLPDVERRIFLFIRSKLSNLNQNGVLVKNSELLEASKTAPASLRNAVSRLKAKSIIEIVETRNGPGGWRLFRLNDRYINN